jgi:hypothetical protein
MHVQELNFYDKQQKEQKLVLLLPVRSARGVGNVVTIIQIRETSNFSFRLGSKRYKNKNIRSFFIFISLFFD